MITVISCGDDYGKDDSDYDDYNNCEDSIITDYHFLIARCPFPSFCILYCALSHLFSLDTNTI